jgi:hypothetical protein
MGDPETSQAFAPLADFKYRLDHIIYVALGIDPVRDRQPHKLHGGGFLMPAFGMLPGMHDRPDLARAYPGLAIKLYRERLAGVLKLRDVRQHRAGINIYGVPAGRLDYRDAMLGDVTAQIAYRSKPVLQVVFVHHLAEPNSYGFEVAARKPAISRESFG